MAPPQLRDAIVSALRQWLLSLPDEVARTKAIYASGAEYSPQQILREVELKTPFGEEFITGLCSLHDWMKNSDPNSSIVDLILRSKRVDQGHPALAHAIGTTAGVIYRVLEGGSQFALENLQEHTSAKQPLFAWAIGWLAREENKIVLTLEEADYRVRLERRRVRRMAAAVGGSRSWESTSWPSRSRKTVEKDHYAIANEIGRTAGDIYRTLEAKGELALPELQREVNSQGAVFNWAIGWLAREGNKVAISLEQGAFRIRLERRSGERVVRAGG